MLTSGAGGRGERLNASQKERMKLLTTAAFDRGKDEDTFGLHDEDWQLYKRMSKDADDLEEADDEEAELSRLTNRLKVGWSEPPKKSALYAETKYLSNCVIKLYPPKHIPIVYLQTIF